MAIEAQQSIFSELADFIVSQPTLTDIAEYRVPAAVEQRVQELLEKNREQGLSQEQQAEMDKFLAVSHLMTLAKAKARLKLPR